MILYFPLMNDLKEYKLLKNATLILRGRCVGESRISDIHIEHGTVRAIKPAGRRHPDFGGPDTIIGPALFDAQVNGVKGINLQGPQCCVGDVHAINDYLHRRGVARWIPTLVTASQKHMAHGCAVIADAMQDKLLATAIPGIHLEGPCISPVDGPRGAHPKKHVRLPSVREFDELMKAAAGKILYVTLAPELKGAVNFIKALTRRGVIVSLGHHAANADQIAKAVDAGARCCTHLGNGAASMIHRHQNPLWPQMADDRLFASMIPDMHHLPADLMNIIVRAKGMDRVLWVSDCTRIAGLPPGHYEEFGAKVELKRSGKLCLEGTDLLAGSAHLLLEGVLNGWQHTDMDLAQSFAAASSNVARCFNLRNTAFPPPVNRKATLLAITLADRKGRATRKNHITLINGNLYHP